MNTDEASHLNAGQKGMIKELFSQGVKHKMKVTLARQLSKTSSKIIICKRSDGGFRFPKPLIYM